MNIYQKLIEVRKAVPYLKKDNRGYQFSYVSSSQILGSLRDAMDKQDLLLVPRVKKSAVADHATSKGGHQYFTTLTMTFTWINAENPDETIECPWYGQGLDDGEKGVGKALTYAEKYFLLKFFNIATDKDDPDSFQQHGNGKQNMGPLPKKPPAPETKKQQEDDPEQAAKEPLVKEIKKKIKAATFDEQKFKQYLFDHSKIGERFGHPSLYTASVDYLITLNDRFAEMGQAYKLANTKKNQAEEEPPPSEDDNAQGEGGRNYFPGG